MQLLNITFPIGWQELATIVTAFGVVVSLFANRKTSRQIKISLLAQEQSKNVELFDKRMEIIEKVQNGTLISSITIRLLFNKGIEGAYIAFDLECARRFSAENDKDRYIKSISEELDTDGYPLPIIDKIKQYENAMNIRNCPSTVSDDFKTYCNEHEIYLLGKDLKTKEKYNYAEIRERLINLSIACKLQEKELLKLMEDFITNSINVNCKCELDNPWQKIITWVTAGAEGRGPDLGHRSR